MNMNVQVTGKMPESLPTLTKSKMITKESSFRCMVYARLKSTQTIEMLLWNAIFHRKISSFIEKYSAGDIKYKKV